MSLPVIDVVAGIIWRDGRYLAVERPEGGPMAGWWEFPGGKIEPGETREQALVRELREELAVTPEDFEFWRELEHAYETFSVRLHFFHIRKYSGELTAMEKQRWAWVDPSRPNELGFLPADAPIVDALHA
ncbi:(deoxy)nucleoside triphosphate pyrophosphohydrolase [Pseudodesulfovibrio sp.]|uniref:(deoxy)nucleoside triphosphate pyrophosphohydrolase n=1 Tax=Pseudodesulfovibrio sp. TaxID=2035812 RepID=UPI00260C987C|nr:(deoxy)nucleoside triphosphate pyrophosphohydrolase [Pseudodesulfovibrio sp.]MDD3310616.1 (deoxy)nucleoside triphosphate pyrophosphohydrolase [Pseudodesulfovibrio sp.]